MTANHVPRATRLGVPIYRAMMDTQTVIELLAVFPGT